MLVPLLHPSFSSFGRIENMPEGESIIYNTSLFRQASIPTYCFDHDTHWDYRSGMTVLLVLDQGRQKQFYLDRPIIIFAGVQFGFFPLTDQSEVIGLQALSQASHIAQPEALTETESRTMPEIFTLFHQVGHGGLYFRGEQHQPLELVYVEKGVLHNFFCGQDVALHPNELLIFDRNQWHMQYAEHDVQFLTVSFLWQDHDLTDWIGRPICASMAVQQAAGALAEAYDDPSGYRDEFLQAQFSLLLLHLLRQVPETAHKPSPATAHARNQVLDKALRVVDSEYRRKLTVAALAAAVNVSTSQLTALFQTHLGIPPAKYITRIRLEESKALLLSQQMSIGEIADYLGYASIQHYSRQFREWFGCSPTAFAKYIAR
ncbi:MAG: helix-turn-helix transcriptional regulator [Oscillospiraceae bacterium]|nr:helix-turn-helix transcriptional regulator [Oscillospiraceae bacterium]